MDEQTLFMLIIFAVPFLALAVYAVTNRPKIVTGPATVESHSVEHSKVGARWSSSWNYLITFRLSDGDPLVLYTTEAEYQTIEDGQTGTLLWDGNQLVEFIPDGGDPL